MRSAFSLENGVRLMFETTPDTITIYYCDELWKPVKEFAQMELTGSEEAYHRNIRYSHRKVLFEEQQSTSI